MMIHHTIEAPDQVSLSIDYLFWNVFTILLMVIELNLKMEPENEC